MSNQSFESIGFLTVDVSRLLRRRFEHALATAGLGLTAGEARTLAYADHYGGVRQAVLADKMGIEPMTLVGFLDRLEARGLVARDPDPKDRRAKLVRPTREAEDILKRIREIGRQVRSLATRGFSDREVEDFRRALKAVRGNLSGGGADNGSV